MAINSLRSGKVHAIWLAPAAPWRRTRTIQVCLRNIHVNLNNHLQFIADGAREMKLGAEENGCRREKETPIRTPVKGTTSTHARQPRRRLGQSSLHKGARTLRPGKGLDSRNK
jgi:hypothetical protein